MTAAVIIPSYNGAHRLANIIGALENQTIRNFKVVVVLDGSNDNSKEVLNGLSTTLDLEIIEQVNKGRAGARNSGANNCTEPLLIFLDDDMRPKADCIEKHIEHSIQYPGSAMVGSLQSDPEIAETEFQHFLAHRSAQWMANLPEQKTRMDEKNLFFSSANCSIARSIFEELGGFNETLRDGEDFELASRILKQGKPLFYNPACHAWHDDMVSLTDYIVRQREYQRAWSDLITKRPELLPAFTQRFPKPRGLKALFFKILADRKWISFSRSVFFRNLPKTFRYHFYEYLIAALGRYHPTVIID